MGSVERLFANANSLPNRWSMQGVAQNEYFRESWINLGVPIVEVIGAEPDPGVEPTEANAGFANEG